jgi:hypothetical protein
MYFPTLFTIQLAFLLYFSYLRKYRGNVSWIVKR